MRYCIFLGVLFWAGSAFSQEKSGPPLTLEAAIEEALGKSAIIRAFEAKLSAVQGEAKARSFIQDEPSLNVSTDAGAGGDFLLQVGLQQQILLPQKRSVERKAGEAAIAAQEALGKTVRVEVAAQVARSYIAFWRASEHLSLSKERAANAKALREAAEKRASAGDITALEVMLAQAEELKATAEVSRDEGDVEQARASLCAVLGRRPDAPIVLAGAPSFSEPAAVEALLQESAKLPRVEAAEQAANAADAELEVTRLALLPSPTVMIGGSFEKATIEGASFVGDPAVIAGITEVNETEGRFFVQLQVPAPLWRKSFTGQLSAARGELAEAEANRDQEKLSLSAEMVAARNKINAAKKAEESLSAIVPKYEDAKKLAEKGFYGGVLSVDSLFLARDRLYNARSELIDARAQTFQAYVELAAITGTLPGL